MADKNREEIEGTFKTGRTFEPRLPTDAPEKIRLDDSAAICEAETVVAPEAQTEIHDSGLDSDPTIELFAGDTAFELPSNYRSGLKTEAYIGPYKLVRVIGQGGMGTVYLAVRDDDQYQKRVAIKLLKRGMDTDDIIRRFRYERQILASLDHPHIARLFDGGATADGRPYYVMEYIEGRTITEYSRSNDLTINERLKLFRKVCSAVQYAHQNLVVHRDIKPSNILVTNDGTVKLLDFGIAKLLKPELYFQTLAPETAGQVMTPQYASPEQVRSETITTASDIYSLGVLLYELLTGQRPYRITNYAPQEIYRLICEQDPDKPSTAVTRIAHPPGTSSTSHDAVVTTDKTNAPHVDKLRRRLRGDLDNIVLMAMRKEPERRYSSAEQLSEDIERHLEGLPVRASKETVPYLAAKFLKRHRAAVVAAALILLTLVGGIATTTWQAYRARAERMKAERRFNDVRKLANSFMFEIHDGIEKLPGSTSVRELLVKRALEYLDSLAEESSTDPSLQRELAKAYLKVGDVQGYPYDANLGDISGARTSYEKALAINQALVKNDSTNPELRRDLLIAYERLGDLLSATGDTVGALANHHKSMELSEALAAADPENIQARRTLLISYLKNGEMLEITGAGAEALAVYRKGETIAESLSSTDPANAQFSRDLSVFQNKIGGRLQETGDFAGALENYRKAFAIRDALTKQDPTNREARRDLATSFEKIADALSGTGDMTGALDSQHKALAIDVELAEADPSNADARLDLAYSYGNLADIFDKSARLKESLENYNKALGILEALTTENPDNTEVSSKLADTFSKMGLVLVRASDTQKGFEYMGRARQSFEALSNADPSNAETRAALASSYATLGKGHARLATETRFAAAKQIEHWREARVWFQKSLDVLTALGTGDNEIIEIKRQIALCDAALADR